MIAWEVGFLWKNPDEKTYSGWIKLPYPLPAEAGLRAVAIPQTIRGAKEKFFLHLEMPLTEPPPEYWPQDLKFKGEEMSEFFRPPRAPGRRYKIMLWGASGTGKTKSALEFPKCAYIDNHGGAENYEAAYPDHKFSPLEGQLATADLAMKAATSLLGDPGDRMTLVVDDMTTYWDQVQRTWSDKFLARLPKSKGHHAEFYSFQPGDWIHPKGEMRSFIRRLLALDMNVIVIARAKKEYAGSGDEFMKVIGEIFAGEINLVYEFDYIFKLVHDGEKRWAEVSTKQRVPVGGKLFPEKFEFTIDKNGRSNFFDIFKKTAAPDQFKTPAHAVGDPVREEIPQAEAQVPEVEERPVAASEDVGKGIPAETMAGETAPAGVITSDQIAQLIALRAEYKIEKEEWDKTLTKFYGATTARALSQEQGDHLTNYLKKDRVPF